MNEQEKAIDDAIGRWADDDHADDFGSYGTGFQRGVQWALNNRILFLGCKVEIDKHCDLSVIKVEPPLFKDGDFVVIDTGRRTILIYKERRDLDTLYYHCFRSSDGYIFYDSWLYNFNSVIRMAAPWEKNSLIEDLAREGKRWNPDTLQIEDIEVTND